MQIYIDDIVVKSSAEKDHLNHLKKSFERMRTYGLKINQNKTKAILETKPPSTKKDL